MSDTMMFLILGHGEKEETEGVGARELAEMMAARHNIKYDICRYDEDINREIEDYRTRYKNIVIVGHSFGGDKAMKILSRFIKVDFLFLLDPVPQSQWFVPAGLAKVYYKIPANVKEAVCLYNKTWGWPSSRAIKAAVNDYTNIPTSIRHENFVRSERCKIILDKRLTKITNAE